MRSALVDLVEAFRATIKSAGSFLGARPASSASFTTNDILWQAKTNALRRALTDHNLTQPDTLRLLAALATNTRGYELASLPRITGLAEAVLERAVPLLGLQNFIRVELRVERRPCLRRPPAVMWVSPTEHGLRYVAEAFSHCPSGLDPGNPPADPPAPDASTRALP